MCIRDRHYTLRLRQEQCWVRWSLPSLSDRNPPLSSPSISSLKSLPFVTHRPATTAYYTTPNKTFNIYTIFANLYHDGGSGSGQKDKGRRQTQTRGGHLIIYPAGWIPVSYTHLDVYKRQKQMNLNWFSVTTSHLKRYRTWNIEPVSYTHLDVYKRQA